MSQPAWPEWLALSSRNAALGERSKKTGIG